MSLQQDNIQRPMANTTENIVMTEGFISSGWGMCRGHPHNNEQSAQKEPEGKKKRSKDEHNYLTLSKKTWMELLDFKINHKE